ncbi:DUF3549 family protein [Salinicola rhizosphaerae]|uniref:DUF3549 family protein n=1 Tax=Salinicola rhizosphaerae TaxID=1443141 RepID=A0ABQ3E9X6_9GAMM|nr:DUF3549 family protein [Salinicola rhizosphaerae]GHB28019.1 hypothetical protein GCM10009038_28500 [Salinicola rhizosphaerae]
MRTLSDFFNQSQADLAISSLGRRVAPISAETFAAFEREEQPWPLPWTGKAQFACAMRWPESGADPLIWFLALPLDEQGQLLPAPRDALLDRLLKTLETRPGVAGDNLMKDNPVAFEPELHQRAVLHARLSRRFEQPLGAQADLARRYLLGDDAINWQMLGLQGLANQVVGADAAIERALVDRLEQLPRDVILPLCYLLEHGDTPSSLVPGLQLMLDEARQQQDLERYCALLRALVGSDDASVGAWLDAWLEDDELMAADCLAAVAARGWQFLEHETRLIRYLERLATCEEANFRSVVRDLALIPRLRLPILMSLRQAPGDSAIGRRLGQLPDH